MVQNGKNVMTQTYLWSWKLKCWKFALEKVEWKKRKIEFYNIENSVERVRCKIRGAEQKKIVY